MAGLAQRKPSVLKATQIKKHGDSEVFDSLCLSLLLKDITHPVDNTLSPKEKNENKVAGSKEGGQGYTVMVLDSHLMSFSNVLTFYSILAITKCYN